MDAIDYSDESATFGDRLVAARLAAGMKPKKLAEQIGVKTSTLRNWEEDRSEPRANRLTIMAGILGVPLVWLMTGQGDGPTEDAIDSFDGEPSADLVELTEAFVAARAEVTAANRKLAAIEKRLKRIALL